jgi:hypothetical protein
VGRGPARHTRLISPVALPRPLCAPGSGTGQLPAQGSDTFTYFSQEPVSAAAMVRNPRPAAAHHLDCHVITSTVTSSPRHSASHQRSGVRFWGQSRRALVTPEFRLSMAMASTAAISAPPRQPERPGSFPTPQHRAGAQHSQSPMDAENRAVMEILCRKTTRANGQNCSFMKI